MGQGQSASNYSDDEDDIEMGRRRRRTDDDDDRDDDERETKSDTKSSQKPGSHPSDAQKQSSDPKDSSRAVTAGMLDDDPDDENGEPAVHEDEDVLVSAKVKRAKDPEAKVSIETEYPMVYGGPCTGANEFTVMVYSGIKIVVFLVVMVVASVTMVKDYQLKECFLSGGLCMKFNSDLNLPICATISDNFCRNVCLIAHPTDMSASIHGCKVTPKDPTIQDDYTCIDTFHSECIETESCIPDHTTKMQGSLLFTIAVLAIHAFFELIYALVMFRFNGRHPNDFDRLNMFDRILTCCGSFWGPVTQVIWFLGLISGIYVYSTYGSEHGACASARTTTGGEYTLFSDAWRIGVGSIALHILIVVVGTHFRSRIPLRGQLYRPGSDAELSVPLGLDCKEIRARSRPRWLGAVFRKFTTNTGVLSCICNCLSCLLDSVCSLTVHVVGWMLEECYKHRHFIGP